MKEPVWIEVETALAIHKLVIEEHGGHDGLRSQALLESALARPRNLFAYSRTAVSLTRLAAAYACGLSRNHPFVDGNKRVALVVAFTFLELNQIEINAPQEETYFVFIDLAAGRLEEPDLARWLKQHARHIEEP